MIKAIDRGTTYTKDCSFKMFKSTAREIDQDLILNNSTKLEYCNKTYIIGEEGNYLTDLMKSQDKNTLLLTLNALADYDTYLDVKLITGLPIGLYSRQKEQMKQMLIGNHSVFKNGIRKQINIRQCEVFPEAAGAFFSTDYKDGLVIDVGGLSIDIALFKSLKLVKYSTYSMGAMKLYSKIANALNSAHDLSLNEWRIEEIMAKGLTIYGESVDTSKIIRELEEQHTQEILNRLKLEYDLKTIDTILLAGGGINIHRCLNRHLIQAETIKNSQYANVIGYKRIGERLYA